MSIRSRYSQDSYVQNRPLGHAGSRRNRVPSPIPPEAMVPGDAPIQSVDFCEACKKCPYKLLVEKALVNTEEQPQTAKHPMQELTLKPTTQEVKEPEKQAGLFKRFSMYVAKNQSANKAAGETTLTEDLMSFGKTYGKGLSDGAAKVANEEIAKIDKKRSTQRSAKDDDDMIDFFSGKRKK